jgi:hypothetical protein
MQTPNHIMLTLRKPEVPQGAGGAIEAIIRVGRHGGVCLLDPPACEGCHQ